MLKQFYQKHQEKIEQYDGFLVNNTILERGLVIAPVIVAANTLASALILGSSFLLLTFLTILLASFVPKSFPYSIRVILYVVIASLLFIPISMLMELIFAENVAKVGFFLPLLVTNSLIVTKTETRFLQKKRGAMALDVFTHSLGFFIVIVVSGTIREILGNGTIMGNPLDFSFRLYAMMLPVGGFILIGYLSALLQRFRLYVSEPEPPKLYKAQRRRKRRRRGGNL